MRCTRWTLLVPVSFLLVTLAPTRGGAASTVDCESFYRINSTLGSSIEDDVPTSGPTQCSASTLNAVSHTLDVGLILATPEGDLVGTPTDNFTMNGQGQASVSAGLGTIHGHAFASVTLSQAFHSYSGVLVDTSTILLDGQPVVLDPLRTGGSVPGTPAGSIVDVNLLGGDVLARSIVNWSDSLTLLMPNAPPNTMIQFTVNTILDATVSAGPCADGSGLNGNARADSLFSVTDATSAFLGGSLETAGTCSIDNVATGPAIVSAPVGAVLGLTGYFNIEAVATLPDGTTGVSSVFASVEALNTAHYYIDILTPGASYVTASGVDYATPVPEPSSFLLGTAGLLLLAGADRRGCSAATARDV